MTVEELVVEELKRRGFEAFYEYPGYVNLLDREAGEAYYASGWLNATWTVDVYKTKKVGVDLEETVFDIPIEGLNTQIPKGFTNIELIATMLLLYRQIRREVSAGIV